MNAEKTNKKKLLIKERAHLGSFFRLSSSFYSIDSTDIISVKMC